MGGSTCSSTRTIARDQLLLRMKVEDWQKVLRIDPRRARQLQSTGSQGDDASTQWPDRQHRIRRRAHGQRGSGQLRCLEGRRIGFTKNHVAGSSAPAASPSTRSPQFDTMTDALTDQQREALIKSLAIRRLGVSRDVADAVAFLAGPGASYITGVVLNCSGGLYI